jgi:hypothetical protein
LYSNCYSKNIDIQASPSYYMKTLKICKEAEAYREEASELRDWMFTHSSPSTSAEEFCEVATRYAALCTKIYMLEKGTKSRI